MPRRDRKLSRRATLYAMVSLFCVVFIGPLSGYRLPGIVQPALAQSTGYTVSGNVIRDPQNNPIQLRGVNWFGFEVPDHVVHGLWARNWQEMITQMKGLGFNAVRVPICPPTLQGSSVSSINYGLNPDLAGKNSLQILDTILARLDAEGMYILLDHHRPDCNAISELWYTGSYSEQQWINDLVFMANRYSNLPHFFGLDLKNEPHGSATWGAGNNSTDWNKAAERAGTAVLAANPKLLIFVEGIGESATCSGNVGHWWGGNLEPQACAPINLPANKLVLSPHVYGPDVYNQPYFNVNQFPANLPAIWESHFGQFSPAHTLVIGEFGGRYGHGGDAKDKIWQDAFVDYLISKNIRNTFYWSWNPNSGDTGGILQDDWTNVWTDKVTLLKRLWGDQNPAPTNTPIPPATATPTPANPATATSTPLTPSTSTPVTPATNTPVPSATPLPSPTSTYGPTPGPGDGCRVTYVKNQWSDGFTGDLLLENLSGRPWNGWTLLWTFSGNQQITNLWNGTVSQSGQAVQVTDAGWNAQVAAGGSTRIGFQASYSGVNAVPTAFQINGLSCNGLDPLPTATNTAMPSATNTPIPPPTNTPTNTPTIVPTNTPINTVPAIPTNTPTVTPVNTVPPVPTNTPIVSPTPVTGAACQVLYQVSNQWQDGFTADVTVRNLSSTPWAGWTVAWSFAGNQQITNLWNGTVIQSGAAVQVANAGWNGSVAAGGSTSFGFQAAYSGPNPVPDNFSVNGLPCVGPQPPSTPTPVPVMACAATYAINNDWGNGFVTTVTLTNQGNVTWYGWTANWHFAGNQQITNLWNGTPTQTGTQVAVANAGWNSTVAPNTSVNFGFVGAYSATNTKPTSIQINGQSCTLSAASAAAQPQQFAVALLEPGQDATLNLAGQNETRLTIPGAAIDAASVALLLPEASLPALPFHAYAVDGATRLLLIRRADAQLLTLAQPYLLTLHNAAAFNSTMELQQWQADNGSWAPLPSTLTTDAMLLQSEQSGSILFTLTEVSKTIFLPNIAR